MNDESGLVNLDNFLFQLALEIRESIQKKDELNQKIQNCQANIKEKKNCIDETQKSINKLDEEILRKQKTVKCYKENVKSLRGTSDLLLHYEKTLEAELERRQDSYDQDVKMFQERIENYWKVFEQHKENYCQNPLASKLLQIQAKNVEIEKRIRATEELVHAKENQGDCNTSDSSPDHDVMNNGVLQPESSSRSVTDRSSHQDPDKVTEPDLEHKALENSDDGSNESDVCVTGNTLWTRPERKREEAAEENERKSGADGNLTPLDGAEILDEAMEDAELTEKTAEVAEGLNEREAGPTSCPVRILDVPTFTLNSSPSTSQQERPETSSFIFSNNSRPATPAFSGFGCSFDPDPSRHESPFHFTSSYFSNKKSPEPKLPGFLFDGSESRTDEDFAFNFDVKSPQSSSSTQEAGGTGDSFSFPFNFGKF